MARCKKIRERGKIRLSEYFKNLKIGDKVAIKRERSQLCNVPERMQGRTGTIEGIRGKAYIVKIKDINQEKRYIVQAIHLKKLMQTGK